MARERVAPELVEVAAARRGERRAHLEAIGLQLVERAQHAVQAGKDGHMRLRPFEVTLAERGGRETCVDIAVEGIHRRLAVPCGEAR